MGHTHPTWFNDQMLRDLGLPQPQTLEEAVATFEKIRESIPDAIILIGRLRDLRMALVGGFTEYGYSKWPDEQGSLQPPEFQPGYRDFVAAMADWYDKGYIFRESFIQHDNIEVMNTGNVAVPYDFDVAYDIAAVKDAVSAYDDIERMIDEETAKFITGTRPLNEWDDFIASLKKIGIDKLYAEYTMQYRAIKGL